jgi:hypothetical protein
MPINRAGVTPVMPKPPLAAHDGTPGAQPGPVVSGALKSAPVDVS